MHTTRPLLGWMIRSHHHIQDEELKENAKLLSGLLLTTIFVVLVIVGLVVYYDPGDVFDLRMVAGYTTIVAAILFFIFNRLGYVRVAIGGFIALLTILFLGVTYIGDFPDFLVFTVIPMLLAGMFHKFEVTAVWITSIVGVVFILNALLIDSTIWDRRIMWYFLLFAGGLVLTSKYHLSRLESVRRTELDEANLQLTATLNALPDLLVEVDSDGLFLNYHASEDVAPYTPSGGYVGRKVSDIFPAATARKLLEALEKAAVTGRHSGTVFSLDLPVGTRWFEVSISAKGKPKQSKERPHFVAVARDITERKQAETLRVERERLELALKQEKELADMRTQLISTITHEFRAPLTVITIAGSMLVQYEDQLSAAEKSNRLEAVLRQVKVLDKMLDDVTTLSKSQQGFLQFHPHLTNFDTFSRQLVDELRSLAQPDQQLLLEMDNDIEPALVDTRLLRHALTNLISNAIKYSPDGGVVTLKLWQSNSTIFFQVSDQGIGIPEQDIAKLFQPFSRASNVGSIQGTGLGLSIVKAIADLHSGNIICNSELGIGTTFRLSIPIDN